MKKIDVGPGWFTVELAEEPGLIELIVLDDAALGIEELIEILKAKEVVEVVDVVRLVVLVETVTLVEEVLGDLVEVGETVELVKKAIEDIVTEFVLDRLLEGET